MGKFKFITASVSVLVGVGLSLFAALPASANTNEGTWTFVTPNGTVVPIQTAEDGSQYWELQLEGDGNFVATWTRREGLWSSSATAVSAFNERRVCQTKVTENYIRRFGSWQDWNNAPTTHSYVDENGGEVWNIEGDAESDAGYAACADASEISHSRVTYTKNVDTGIYTARIPLSMMGPGTNNLFIQNLVYTDDRYNPSLCNVVPAAELGWSDRGVPAGCQYTPGTFQRISVNVEYPMSDSGHQIAGPEVAKKTWFDQGVYSDLAPISWDFFGNFNKFVGPVAATLGVTAVFAVLIALPTSLMESSLEANHGRVESMLRKFVPGYKRRQDKKDVEAEAEATHKGEN